MKTFTDADRTLLIALRDVVFDKGINHIYDETERGNYDGGGRCTYVNYRDGGVNASCLIGSGLVSAGLATVDALTDYEGKSADYVLRSITNASEDMQDAANRMQGQQDAGSSWGFSYLCGILYLSQQGYDVSPYSF